LLFWQQRRIAVLTYATVSCTNRVSVTKLKFRARDSEHFLILFID
jgi:hypothetical protein